MEFERCGCLSGRESLAKYIAKWYYCNLGNVGSSVLGRWPILGSKSQDISTSGAFILAICLLWVQLKESAILNSWSTTLIHHLGNCNFYIQNDIKKVFLQLRFTPATFQREMCLAMMIKSSFAHEHEHCFEDCLLFLFFSCQFNNDTTWTCSCYTHAGRRRPHVWVWMANICVPDPMTVNRCPKWE